jgi:hypothetical protein
MTQYKVAELSGVLLDAAVALTEGFPLCEEWNQTDYILIGTGAGDLKRYSPSTNWAIGGPIIEREVIVSQFGYGFWFTAKSSLYDAIWSDMQPYHIEHEAQGKTLLESAMRTYVMSKFGEAVELHD